MKAIPWPTFIRRSVKLTNTDDHDHEWEEFVDLIQSDLLAFKTHFKKLEFSFSQDEFVLLDKDNNTREAIYTFSFMHYQRCSDSSWEQWEPVLLDSVRTFSI